MQFLIDDVKLTNSSAEPTITPNGAVTISPGNNGILTSSAAAQYSWSGPGGMSNPVPSQYLTITQAGCYTVTVWDMNNCMKTSQPVCVSMVAPPVATNNGPTCPGAPITLSAAGSPASSYTWTNPAGVVFSNQQSTVINPPVSGNYTLTTSGPASISTTFVDVLPPDNAAFAYGSGTFCQTGINPVPTTLVSMSGTFTSTPAGLSINATTGEINLAASTLGTHTVTFTTNGTCSATFSQTISIVTSPNACFSYPATQYCQSAANPSPVSCAGASFGVFSATPSGLSIVASTGVINLASSASGIYTVYNTIPASGGCAATLDSTQITVLATASTPIITSNSPVCAGQTLTLSVVNPLAGATYSWVRGGVTHPSTASMLTFPTATAALNAGTWTVYATLNGCTSPAGTVNALVYNPPSAPTVLNSGPGCVGQPLQFSASGITGASYTWTHSSGNFTYFTQNPVIPAATLAHSGTWSVIASIGSCVSAPATTTVTVNPSPPAPLASSNSPVCVGDTLMLFGQSVQGATYNWQFANYTTSIQNPLRANATPAYSGIYTLTISLNGCSSSDTTHVVIDAGSIAVTSGTPQVCPGSLLSLTANSNSANPYTWTGPNNFSATGSVVTVPNMSSPGYGTYTVTSQGTQCNYYGSITINEPAAPGIIGVTSYCAGNTIQLSGGAVPGVLGYYWTGPNGFTSNLPAIEIPNATAADAGIYSVVAVYDGCTSAPAMALVTVNSAASLTATANTPLYQGSTLFLSAAGPSGMYTWTGPSGFYAYGSSPYIQNVQAYHAGNYTVSFVNCGVSAVVNVQVNPRNQISGTVYNDANSNGVQDAGEQPRPNMVVKLQPGNAIAYTNSAGQYTFYVLPGSYTVSVQNQYATQVVLPATYSVTTAGSGQVYGGNNFGVYTPAIQDVKTFISQIANASPGFPAHLRVFCQNIGTVPASGTIKFLPGSLLVMNTNFTAPGYTLSGDTLIWNYYNLAPGASIARNYYAIVPAGTPLGTVITSSAFVTPLTGDVAPANNSYTISQTVIS
ncbi:MAG: hypothetical protein EOP51_21060, partial [Sphingobacteriales bacterium]